MAILAFARKIGEPQEKLKRVFNLWATINETSYLSAPRNEIRTLEVSYRLCKNSMHYVHQLTSCHQSLAGHNMLVWPVLLSYWLGLFIHIVDDLVQASFNA